MGPGRKRAGIDRFGDFDPRVEDLEDPPPPEARPAAIKGG